MAIEIDVADQIGMSAIAGVLQGTVIIRFDGPMRITVLFKDCGSREANNAAAVAAAKQLAFRLAQERVQRLPQIYDAAACHGSANSPSQSSSRTAA
jgi:hypothetical protein